MKIQKLEQRIFRSQFVFTGQDIQWQSAMTFYGQFETSHSNITLPPSCPQAFFDPPRQSSYIAYKINQTTPEVLHHMLEQLVVVFFFNVSSMENAIPLETKSKCSSQTSVSKWHFTNSCAYLHIHPKQYLANLNWTVLKNSVLLSDMHK